jgi:hypothetical protein
MNETGENDRDAPRREEPGGRGADANHQARRRDDPAVGLETALESGHVELKDIVRLLACRLLAAERRLARIDRWMDPIDRRISRAESRLAAQGGQASKHEEAIRMICTLLKDLDDPYGFGLSLDERLAYDGTNGLPEEE